MKNKLALTVLVLVMALNTVGFAPLSKIQPANPAATRCCLRYVRWRCVSWGTLQNVPNPNGGTDNVPSVPKKVCKKQGGGW